MTGFVCQEAGDECPAADFGGASHEFSHDVDGPSRRTGDVAIEFGEAEAWVEGVDDDDGGR